MVLTDIGIRALKATGKQEKFWCSQTPNFGLLLSQAGGKSFFFMAPGTRRRIPLGKMAHHRPEEGSGSCPASAR
jgi:hypothetical protein